MCFLWPEHFVFLLLLIPLAVLYGYGFRRRMRAIELLAGVRETLVAERKQLLLRTMMQFVALAMFLLALTGAQLCRVERIVFRKGADIVFILDVSSSMLATDVSPSRLEEARRSVRRISETVPEGRRSLLLFAASPLVQCPLTSDRAAFDALLGMASPALVENQGSAFSPALDLALRLTDVPAASTGSEPVGSEKILVLLSDGEDHEGGVDAAAKRIRKADVSLFVLGFGRGEAFLPDTARPGSVKLDASGDAVKTRFSAGTLQRLAATAGGRYYHVSQSDTANDLVAARINDIVARSRVVPVFERGYPFYPWLLGIGLLLLFGESVLRVAPKPSNA